MAKKKARKNRKPPAPILTKADSPVNPKSYLARAGKTAILLALIPLVFLLYSNTLNSPFILDDGNNIENNPHIRLTRLSLEGLWDAGFQGISAYRPVSKISFALNYYFHRYDLRGYHLINILIHIVTGIFLFVFLKTTLNLPSLQVADRRYAWVPFLTVLIWLVHPVQTQSVTYIVQRMTSLAAMFYILSLLFYVKARRSERRGRKVLLYTGCILAGILGFGSKQITATLPLFILLYEWYFFQDLSRAWLKRNVLPIAGVLIIIGTLSLIYLGLNPIEHILATYENRDFTPGQRMLTQFRAVIFYISLIIFPHPSRLNLDRDFLISSSPLHPLTTIICMAAVILLIGVAIYGARRQRLLSFGILWFLGNLVIESSVIGLEIIFDHRTYLPSMFVIFIPVLLIQRYVRPKIVGFIFLGVVALMFSIWTYERNHIWKDKVSLWQDCVIKSPHKARPHNNLGVYLIRQGGIEEAIEHYSEALRIDPEYADAHLNMGDALARKGMYEDAIRYFSKALHIKPNFAKAHFALARTLQRIDKLDEAIIHFSRAVQIKPEYYEAHYYLGNALREQREMDGAIRSYLRAIKIRPDFAPAQNNLGTALGMQGRYQEAVEHLSEAVRLKPSNADYHFNLANALAGQGKHEEALGHYSKAAGLNPFDAELQQALKRAEKIASVADKN